MSSIEIKAAELSPAQKAVIEELLGREVSASDTIALRSFSAEQREQARKALMEWLERRTASAEEAEEPIPEDVYTEAMRSVRPNYRPIS